MATRKTTDALEILHARYVRGNTEGEAELESTRERLRLSMQLHELRKQSSLTQKEVAERAGTKRSVIARLEQPGYEKHTVSTLHRVARALGYAVKVEFVPLRKAVKRKPVNKLQPVRIHAKMAVKKAASRKAKSKH